MIVKFGVFGQPTPKARQRHHLVKCKDGRQFISNYLPKTSAVFENQVGYEYRMQCGGRPPHEGPIGISMKFFFTIPKSTPKKHLDEMLSERKPVLKKPDIDNLVKSVLDGLLGIAYKDDSQIYVLACGKYYSGIPRTEITIAFDEPTESKEITNA